MIAEAKTIDRPAYGVRFADAEAHSFRTSAWMGVREGRIRPDVNNAPHFIFRLRRPIDASRLSKALDCVVARHDVLRAAVIDRDGEPWIAPDDRKPDRSLLETVDLSGATTDGVRLAVSDWLWSEIDLLAGRPWKALLVRLGRDDHILVFVIHHFVGDAASAQIIWRGLLAAYERLLDGRAVELPSAGRYVDYLNAVRSWAGSASGREHRAYWLKTLGEIPPGQFSEGRDRSGGGYLETVRRISIDGVTYDRLKRHASRLGTSCQVLLTSIQFDTLVRITGESLQAMTAVTSKRDIGALGDTVGYLADRLFYTVKVRVNAPMRERVDAVHAAITQSWKRQHYPADMIFDALNEAGAPLALPCFNFRAERRQSRRLQGGAETISSLEPYPAPMVTPPPAEVSYSLHVAETNDGLSGVFRARARSLAGFADAFLVAAQEAAAQPL